MILFSDLNYCTHNDPCQNDGVCTNTGEGRYTCDCLPNSTGTNCETIVTDCHVDTCENGGTCMVRKHQNV